MTEKNLEKVPAIKAELEKKKESLMRRAIYKYAQAAQLTSDSLQWSKEATELLSFAESVGYRPSKQWMKCCEDHTD